MRENQNGGVSVSAQKRLIERLRVLRKKHGLTQEGFSELSGISYKYYQQIEIGRKPDLRFSTLERLAKAYGIEVHRLLGPELPTTQVKGPKGAR